MTAPDVAAVVGALVAPVVGLDPRRTPDMLELGRILLDVQSMLPARAFEPWRRHHLPAVKRRSALNYMAAASRFGADVGAVAHLLPTAVVRLATAAMPEDDRDAIVDKVRKGSRFSAAEIERQAAAARERAEATAKSAERERRRRVAVRDFEREQQHVEHAADEGVRAGFARYAAQALARGRPSRRLREAVEFADPKVLRDLILQQWDLPGPDTLSEAAPRSPSREASAAPVLRLQKRKSPGG